MEYPTQITVKSTEWATDPMKNTTTLVVTDSTGAKYHINDKRQALWPVFDGASGQVVLLNWKMPAPGSTWKPFIEKAQRQITTPTPPSAITASAPVPPVQPNVPYVNPFLSTQPKPVATPVVPPVKDFRNDSIESQTAFKGLVELDVADKLSPELHLLIVAWALDKMGVKEEPVAQPKLEPAKPQPIKAVKK